MRVPGKEIRWYHSLPVSHGTVGYMIDETVPLAKDRAVTLTNCW